MGESYWRFFHIFVNPTAEKRFGADIPWKIISITLIPKPLL